MLTTILAIAAAVFANSQANSQARILARVEPAIVVMVLFTAQVNHP